MTALLEYPDVKAEWKITKALSVASVLAVLPIGFMLGGERINYFSMVTTVGTPQTIAAEELRVECLFPADDATEAHHETLIAHRVNRSRCRVGGRTTDPDACLFPPSSLAAAAWDRKS